MARRNVASMDARVGNRVLLNQGRGRDWSVSLGLELDRAGSGAAVYLQIVHAIADAIRDGRIPTASRLPGSRVLAATLGVHRNTILKVYAELTSEGWLETSSAKGTFVARDIPETRLARVSRGKPTELPFELPRSRSLDARYAEPDPAMVQLYGGSSDLRLLPTVAIARAYRRALRRASRLLNYGDPRGNPALRAELVTFLGATRGLALTPEEILITRGSQMGLYLAFAALLQPGDPVVVEELGYPPAWHALRLQGAELLPCKVDGQGLDTERLAKTCERQRRKGRSVRAVYVTPHHQYPTTVTLSPGRRMRLAELAAEYQFVVIEDDYCHEFQYEGQPTLPLVSTLPRGSVVYVGTLSKVLAPGLRLGFLVAPTALLERATTLRYFIDRQGDAATEAAVAELMEDGEVQRHIRKTRWLYRERRDNCVEGLRRTFAEQLSFEVPEGGMALWIRCLGVQPDRWLEQARRLGIEFQLGMDLSLRRHADEYVRLGFASVTPHEMNDAIARLATAWRRAARSRT